jgi:hypothetical protein
LIVCHVRSNQSVEVREKASQPLQALHHRRFLFLGDGKGLTLALDHLLAKVFAPFFEKRLDFGTEQELRPRCRSLELKVIPIIDSRCYLPSDYRPKFVIDGKPLVELIQKNLGSRGLPLQEDDHRDNTGDNCRGPSISHFALPLTAQTFERRQDATERDRIPRHLRSNELSSLGVRRLERPQALTLAFPQIATRRWFVCSRCGQGGL